MQLVCYAARVFQAQLGMQVVELGGAAQQKRSHHCLSLSANLQTRRVEDPTSRCRGLRPAAHFSPGNVLILGRCLALSKRSLIQAELHMNY